MYLPKFDGDQCPRPYMFRRPCEEKMVPGHSFTSSKNSVKKLKQTRLLHALIAMHSESFNEFVILKLDCFYVIFPSHKDLCSDEKQVKMDIAKVKVSKLSKVAFSMFLIVGGIYCPKFETHEVCIQLTDYGHPMMA